MPCDVLLKSAFFLTRNARARAENSAGDIKIYSMALAASCLCCRPPHRCAAVAVFQCAIYRQQGTTETRSLSWRPRGHSPTIAIVLDRTAPTTQRDNNRNAAEKIPPPYHLYCQGPSPTRIRRPAIYVSAVTRLSSWRRTTRVRIKASMHRVRRWLRSRLGICTGSLLQRSVALIKQGRIVDD